MDEAFPTYPHMLIIMSKANLQRKSYKHLCRATVERSDLQVLFDFDLCCLHLRRGLGQIFISKLHRIKLCMMFVFEN